MPRKYEKVQKLLPEVQRLNAEGYTHRQIAEKLGLGGKEVVKQLLQRERRKEIPGIRKQRGRTDTAGIAVPVCCIILFSCLGGLFCAVRIFWGGNQPVKK